MRHRTPKMTKAAPQKLSKVLRNIRNPPETKKIVYSYFRVSLTIYNIYLFLTVYGRDYSNKNKDKCPNNVNKENSIAFLCKFCPPILK